MNIAILYGTETGNAEMLAEDLAAHLSDDAPEVTNLSDFDPAAMDGDTLWLVITSTYGDGELPASAKPFGEKMEAGAPDLSGTLFAVFGMGDSAYPETFNYGGKRIEEMLTAAGARMVGARVTHDASGSDMAEDLCFPWAEAVIAEARRAAAA